MFFLFGIVLTSESSKQVRFVLEGLTPAANPLLLSNIASFSNIVQP